MPKFKTPYAHDESSKFYYSCMTPSMTEQQFEYELNLNNIIKGCVNSALPVQTQQALFDLTITGDEFEKSLNANAEVLNYFEQLPVEAKKFFNYEPKKMLDFVQDDKNYEKAFDLGLLDKEAYKQRKFAFIKSQKAEKETHNTPPEVIPQSGNNA